MKITLTRTRWSVATLLGWANVLLGVVALTPAIFGYGGYWIWGGVFGLVAGGVLVSVGGPLRVIQTFRVEGSLTDDDRR